MWLRQINKLRRGTANAHTAMVQPTTTLHQAALADEAAVPARGPTLAEALAGISSNLRETGDLAAAPHVRILDGALCVPYKYFRWFRISQ